MSEKHAKAAKLLKVLTERGPIDLKGKGATRMFFLEGIRPELSEAGRGLRPNAIFQERRTAMAGVLM